MARLHAAHLFNVSSYAVASIEIPDLVPFEAASKLLTDVRFNNETGRDP